MDPIDFTEVFHTLAQPLAICDPSGLVLTINPAARRVLGLKGAAPVRLCIDERETLSAMQRAPQAGAPLEFFMADVPLQGATTPACSVLLAPLESGRFRVTFIEDAPAKGAPSVRLLRALSAVTEHAAIFDDPLELLTLFGSCLLDVFPEYAWRMELVGAEQLLAAHEVPFEQDLARGGVEKIAPGGARRVVRGERLWAASKSGERVWSEVGDEVMAGVQIETRRSRGLSDAESEALALFMNFFGFISHRYLLRDPLLPVRHDVFGTILEQLEAGVALCDRRRIVRSANEALARMLGLATEEIPGQDVIELFPEPARAQLRRAAAAVMGAGESASLDLRDVQGRSVTLRVAPVARDGEGGSEAKESPGGFWLIAQPSEQSLRVLEDEFARAEQLMQLGELASGVAHELKNPLTSIMNYADYLLQKYRDQLFEKRDSERLVRIIEGVERMDLFIRDLVTLARPQGQDAPAIHQDIHQVIRHAHMLCEVCIEEHRVRVVESFAATRAEVLGVQGQLVQVFVNLMTNAAVAMPEQGGTITLGTSVQQQWLVCEVSDDGQGIDAATLERVFEPFFTTRKATGGSGLGLSLVRALVERHGGRITLESVEGEGSVARIFLPLLPAA